MDFVFYCLNLTIVIPLFCLNEGHPANLSVSAILDFIFYWLNFSIIIHLFCLNEGHTANLNVSAIMDFVLYCLNFTIVFFLFCLKDTQPIWVYLQFWLYLLLAKVFYCYPPVLSEWRTPRQFECICNYGLCALCFIG